MILHLDDCYSCCFRQQIKFMVLGKIMAITTQHILISEGFGEVMKYWDGLRYTQASRGKNHFFSLMIIISTGIWLLPFNNYFFFLISQLILVPCKAHRLHSPLVVIPWQKCQAIWSPQHQHPHLMDRWHLCKVAGMKRALLHFLLVSSSTAV